MKSQKGALQPSRRVSITTLINLLFCPRCFWLAVRYGVERPGHHPKIMSKLANQMSLAQSRLRCLNDRALTKIFGLKVQLADLRKVKEIGHRLSYTDNKLGLRITGEIDDYAISPRRGTVIPVKTKTWGGEKYKAEDTDVLRLGLSNLLLQGNGHKVEWRGFLALWLTSVDAESLVESGGKPRILNFALDKGNIHRFLKMASRVANSAIWPEADPDCEFCKNYGERLEASVLAIRDSGLYGRHRRPRK